jgi:hypothetical protein
MLEGGVLHSFRFNDDWVRGEVKGVWNELSCIDGSEACRADVNVVDVDTPQTTIRRRERQNGSD